MAANDPKNVKAPTDFFGSAFVVWCFVVFGGASVAGPPSGEYGALTMGAILALVAMLDGIVSVVLVIVRRFKDWRAWAAFGLSALTVVAATLRSSHHSGP